MSKVAIPISSGLRFSERSADNARFLDLTYTAKPGVLSSRKAHSVLLALSSTPRKLLFSLQQQAVFSLTTSGQLFKGTSVVDSGYSQTQGSLLELAPNSSIESRYIFIAGATKMRKYSGATVSPWGIDAPPASVLVTSPAPLVIHAINGFEDAGQWTASGCSISEDTGIFTEGLGSLKVDLSSGVVATITWETGGSLPTFDSFGGTSIDVRVHDNFGITQFNLSLVDIGGVEYKAAAASSIYSTSTQDIFLPVSLSATDYTPTLPSQLNIIRVIISMVSSSTQSIYLDNFRGSLNPQDDIKNSRYKYAYANEGLGTHSNLNSTPSTAVSGAGGGIQVTGFIQPPSPDLAIWVYRDTNSDGNYRFVGSAGLWFAGIFYIDTASTGSLGETDPNNNNPPPLASLAVYFKGSVWVNDLSNLRRLWRSVPGQYESFSLQQDSGFFDVSVVGDEILSMGIVRGQMYLVTRQSIIQVLAADLVPSFVEVVNIGAVSENASHLYKDLLTFIANIGVFTFDGANLQTLPHIETLFNPLTSDVRAITPALIPELIIGNDAKHIWLSVGSGRMYTYALDQKVWAEESVPLTAHELDHIGFYHIASSLNTVYNTYGSSSYATFGLRTDQVELPSIGHINGIELEYFSQVAITAIVYVDGALVSNTGLVANSRRTWAFISLDQVLGQQIEIELQGQALGLVELYSIQAEYTGLLDLTHFDSEYFKLPEERCALTELELRLYGLATGTVAVSVFVDSTTVRVYNVALTRNQPFYLRSVLSPTVGANARVNISGSRFAVIALGVNVVILGNGERKHISVPLRAN